MWSLPNYSVTRFRTADFATNRSRSACKRQWWSRIPLLPESPESSGRAPGEGTFHRDCVLLPQHWRERSRSERLVAQTNQWRVPMGYSAPNYSRHKGPSLA